MNVPADAPQALFPALYLLSTVLLVVGLPLFVVEVVRLIRDKRFDRDRFRAMATSAFCLVPATLVELGLGGALEGAFEWLSHLALFDIPTTWGTAIVCVVLVDLLYYVEHRAAHRVHGLWAIYHSVHHSGRHYDQSVGLRVSFVDFFISPLYYLPLVILGFHPALVLLGVLLMLAWQQWLHTEVIGKLPLLDPWLNTPSNHRVHHGRNPQYIDKNYGGILIVWDRLFGSYAKEVEPVEYGLVEQLESDDPISVHTFSLHKLAKRVRRATSLREAAALVFGPPEGPSTPTGY